MAAKNCDNISMYAGSFSADLKCTIPAKMSHLKTGLGWCWDPHCIVIVVCIRKGHKQVP
jgi:hypothetical protein